MGDISEQDYCAFQVETQSFRGAAAADGTEFCKLIGNDALDLNSDPCVSRRPRSYGNAIEIYCFPAPFSREDLRLTDQAVVGKNGCE